MTTNVAKQLTRQLTQSTNINCLIAQFQRCMSVKKVRLPHRLVVQGVDPNRYSHMPIPYPKDGGRGVDGRVSNRRVSGGCTQNYRMIDTARPTPPAESDKPVSERVLQIRTDPQRTAKIALVAHQNDKRWIICPNGVQKGDIINSHGQIPLLSVQAKSGDSHPVGAFAVGSVVHNVETHPSAGGVIARAAGTSAVLMKKVGESCLLKIPSGREIIINQQCIATCGRVSNVDHNKRPIGSPNRMRWLGIKQRSGLRKRKTGYNGKKLKKKKPTITYDKSVKATNDLFDV